MNRIWVREIIDYLKSHIATCFFLTFFLGLGIVCGAVTIRTLSEPQLLELADYLQVFFVSLTDEMKVSQEVFETALFHHVKGVVLIWLLGFTMIGIPAIFFLTFTQGFVLGFSVGFLLHEYILRGVLFVVIGVLPQQLILIPCNILMAVWAVSLSMMLIRKCIARRDAGGMKRHLWHYGVLLPIGLAVTVVGTLTEVYVSPFLLKAIYTILS